MPNSGLRTVTRVYSARLSTAALLPVDSGDKAGVRTHETGEMRGTFQVGVVTEESCAGAPALPWGRIHRPRVVARVAAPGPARAGIHRVEWVLDIVLGRRVLRA